jgi:ABC-type transport system substrate-binding protein
MIRQFFILSQVIALAAISANADVKETKFVQKPTSYDKLPDPKKGGSLIDSMSNNPKVINPLLSDDANSTSLEGFLWASLFTEDSDNFNPIPYLATSYKVSGDRKTYTFDLNPDAKWEDGTPVTTADIKFTFDTMMNPKVNAAPIRSYWEGVKLEVTNDRNFKFTIETPKFNTLRFLYSFAPIQAKQFANESDFNKAKGIMNPIGNGPYRLKGFSRDQKVEFERVKDWWGNKNPIFKKRFNSDTVIVRVVPDPNLVYERWIKGDLDYTTFEPASYEIYATKVRGSDKDRIGKSPADGKSVWATEINNSAARGFTYLGWNLRKPVFQSKKTRQALARLVDYQQIIDKVLYGYAYQSTSPFGSKTMNSDASLRSPGKMLTYDRKAAIQMLKEDGWADTDKDNILDKTLNGTKVPFRFVLRYNSNNPARGKIAQIVKENFKSAGIDVEIRAMEWNAYLADIDQRNFDAIVMAWTGQSFPDAKQIWHTDSSKDNGSNFGGFSNPEVDKLIAKSNLEFDMAKRAKIMQQINRIIYEEQPYAFLYEPGAMIAGFNQKVKSKVWARKYDSGPAIDIYTFVE